MTDIFLSYSSKDRVRVAPLRDALAALGYDVFWDQAVPTGTDWDTWIRQQLGKARCTIVVWSEQSVASQNVRHEATVASNVGKLIPVLVDPLTPDQFPMGLYNMQAANLIGWQGDEGHADWRKLRSEVESKIRPHAPIWMQNLIHGAEAELIGSRARLNAAESRARTLEEKLGQDASSVLEAERSRTRAEEEIAALKRHIDDEVLAKRALVEQGKALTERLAKMEADRQELALRLGLTDGANAKLPGSRGHIGLVDLIMWLAAAAYLGGLAAVIFGNSPQAREREIAAFLSVGCAVASFWFLIVLIRYLRRRRIAPMAVSTPAQQASQAATTTILSARGKAGDAATGTQTAAPPAVSPG